MGRFFVVEIGLWVSMSMVVSAMSRSRTTLWGKAKKLLDEVIYSHAIDVWLPVDMHDEYHL